MEMATTKRRGLENKTDMCPFITDQDTIIFLRTIQSGYANRHSNYLEILFLFNLLFICLGYAVSQLWLKGSSLWCANFLVAACMWDLVPSPGVEPGPSALGVWSLTNREIPRILFLFVIHASRTHLSTQSGYLPYHQTSHGVCLECNRQVKANTGRNACTFTALFLIIN